MTSGSRKQSNSIFIGLSLREGWSGDDIERIRKMEGNEQDRHDRESAESHRASIEIADALAKMFAEMKPKIMAKYSLEDEQVILLAIAKAAVKLGTNSMPADSLTPDQTEKLERKLQSIMLNAFMFGEVNDD
jgi:hypothetical protein